MPCFCKRLCICLTSIIHLCIRLQSNRCVCIAHLFLSPDSNTQARKALVSLIKVPHVTACSSVW